MSTITYGQSEAIRAFVMSHEIPAGLGTESAACSVAAINLALTGELTDTIPECMSRVVGRWIINVQDRMPTSIRNSAEWKTLLPLAAGTGRELERERLLLVMDWMWVSLAIHQPIAERRGYGAQWLKMTTDRTRAVAAYAAAAAAADADAVAAYAAAAADAAAYADAAADAAAYAAAAYAADAADAAADAAAADAAAADAAAAHAAAPAAAAPYAADAAYAYAAADAAYAYATAWQQIDPVAMLRK